MLRIVITGGIACGKSAVASIISETGIPVCEADDLAHSAIKAGSSSFERICLEFGEGILDEDGEISRKKLGEIIFSDPEKRALLNKIVHPVVRSSWKTWLDNLEKDEKFDTAAVVIPLLYEINDQGNWDAVVCVTASENIQIQRLQKRGMSAKDAVNRIKAQLSVLDKMRLADYVIFNNSAEDVLVRQTEKVLDNIIGNYL